MAHGMNSGRDREGMLRRVAIVLSSLPPSVAAQLIGSIEPGSKQAVRRAISTLEDVDPLERRRAFQAFQVSVQQEHQTSESQANLTSIHQTSDSRSSTDESTHTRKTGSAAARVVAGQHVRQNSTPATPELNAIGSNPLAFLNDVEDYILLRLLGGEHPQTVALVLASVSPEKAGRFLPMLDARTQTETLSRIGRLEGFPEAAIADFAEYFKQRIREHVRENSKSPGRSALDAILAAMPSENRLHAGAPTQRMNDSVGFQSGPAFPTSEEPTKDLAHKLKIAEQTLTPSSDSTNTADATHHYRSDRRKIDNSTEYSDSGTPALFESTDAIASHLERLPAAELCQALGTVDTRTAMLALCGLPNRVAESALSKLPKAEAKKVRTAMNSLGSLNLRDIDDAKEAVARASVGTSSRQMQHAPLAA